MLRPYQTGLRKEAVLDDVVVQSDDKFFVLLGVGEVRFVSLLQDFESSLCHLVHVEKLLQLLLLVDFFFRFEKQTLALCPDCCLVVQINLLLIYEMCRGEAFLRLF